MSTPVSIAAVQDFANATRAVLDAGMDLPALNEAFVCTVEQWLREQVRAQQSKGGH